MRIPAPDRGPELGGSGSSADPVPADDSPYWTFYEEVASRELADWAPQRPARVLDLSGGRSRFALQLVEAGHEVVHVCLDPRDSAASAPTGPAAQGRLLPVVADPRSLSWLRDQSVDAVLAEARALSMCLATEVTVLDLHRVLRPGGRMLLVVDSLGLGLARLAEQGRWAELADVPSADVVLVPDAPDGTITRCFWPEELRGLLTDAGFEVEAVRPRTVLTPAAVERALAQGGRGALDALVESELGLEARTGDWPGLHLAARVRRPG